jgi:hypothetical protein
MVQTDVRAQRIACKLQTRRAADFRRGLFMKTAAELTETSHHALTRVLLTRSELENARIPGNHHRGFP